MSAIFTADLHMSDNPRDEYRWRIWPFLYAELKKAKAKLLIIAGDLTEAKDHHSAELVNRLVHELRGIAQHYPVVVMKGNHDFLTDPDLPFFTFINRIPGLTLISAPTRGENVPAVAAANLGEVLILPFSHNPMEDWKGLDMDGFNWIFTHQLYLGSKGVPGGIDPGIFFPPKAKVLSGDVHEAQQVGPVTYVGSPYSIDFGDAVTGRVLLIDKTAMRSILYYGPQKTLVETACLNDLHHEGMSEGMIVKVRIPPDPKMPWQEVKAGVMAIAEQYNCQVWAIQPIGAEVKSRKLTGQKPAKSDDDLIRAFGKKRGLPPEVVKSGLWIAKNA